MKKRDLVSMIDYTLLKPTVTKDDITTFCNETIEHGFQTVFVNPYYVAYAYNLLLDNDVKVGAPIGYSLGGATVEDVKLLRFVVGDNVGVKAAGGIRTFADAAAMVGAGANRIGASGAVAIISGQTSEKVY